MDDSEIRTLISLVPYARTIGIKMSEETGCYLLPVKMSNVGNPTLPALHGGAVAGFMELSAMLYVLQQSESEKKRVKARVKRVKARAKKRVKA